MRGCTGSPLSTDEASNALITHTPYSSVLQSTKLVKNMHNPLVFINYLCKSWHNGSPIYMPIQLVIQNTLNPTTPQTKSTGTKIQ